MLMKQKRVKLVGLQCKWNNTDCRNVQNKCDFCIEPNMFYAKEQEKTQTKRQNRRDFRTGARFEHINHKANEVLVSSNKTINSGATNKEKGDEQISGIIEIMEELKTKVTKQAPGQQTFTIKKSWLEKLNREAKAENKEFWYLKFCFQEHEALANDIYIVVESNVLMSMVATMISDRKKAKLVDLRIKEKDNEIRVLKAKVSLLHALVKGRIDKSSYGQEVEKIQSMFVFSPH